MSLFPTSDSGPQSGEDVERRLESIVTWLDEIDSRLRSAELAAGDEKTAKELRKAVEAVAKHDPKLEERLGSKIDVLTDRVATLATTVSTTAAALARKDGEIVSLQRELDAGKVRIEEVAGQARGGGGASASEIAELRSALDSVSEQKLPKKIDGRLDGLKESVSLLAQRVETLSTTVSTTASGLAGREGDLAALRRRLEEESARLAGELGALRSSIDPAPVAELRQAVDQLRTETTGVKRDNQRGLDAVKAGVEALTGRIDAASTAASAATTALAASEERVGSLRAAFDEESGRVDGLLVKLHQATGELASRVMELDGTATQDAIDELATRLSELTSRVESLGASVQQTAAGYADKEHEIAALNRRFEDISGHVDAGVRDLRAAIDAMAERGIDPELESRIADLGSELGAFATRLDEVDASVASGWSAASQASAALDHRLTTLAQQVESASDGELAARVEAVAVELATLETRYTEVEARTSGGWSEATSAIAGLDQRLTALAEHLETTNTQHLEGRLEGVAEEVAALVARFGEVDARSASGWGEATSAIAALDHRLAALGERLDGADTSDVPTQVEALRGELERLAGRLEEASTGSTAGLGEVSALVSALEERVSGVGLRLEELGDERARAEAESAQAAESHDAELRAAAEESKELRERIAAVGASQDDLAAAITALQTAAETAGVSASDRDRELHELSERFETASERVNGLVGELHAALETMPTPVTADTVENGLSELGDRLGAVEESGAAAALEIARASASWADERRSLHDELEALETALHKRVEELAEIRGSSTAVPDELAERLDRADEERTALASEIAGARAFWSSGLGAMEARLQALSGSEESPRKVDDEVVHALFDIARRLDAVEHGRATSEAEIVRTAESWAAERDSIAAGLDELTRRLDSVGADGGEAVGAAGAAEDSADGRYRLELRALELRMEHAEAAARENRDAVLVQLERLASRIEWRLQRLETGTSEGPAPEAVDGPLAKVVSIHGADA